MEAIITIGVPRSGKTTYAREECPHHIDVNRDVARVALTGLTKTEYWKQKGSKIKEIEKQVTEYCEQRIQHAAMSGRDIIVSDTNLNEPLRNALIKRLENYGFDVVIKEFDVPWVELMKRNEKSDDYVNSQVMYSMWKKWLDYKGQKTYEPNLELPKAVIFDVDGTLARMSDRSPFAWQEVGNDTLIEPNKLILDGFRKMGLNIVIFTGRDGSCADITKQWLTDNGIIYDDFYIREAGDMRKDYIIKEEILWQAAEKWNFVGVVDDRPQVVSHWHDLGLHVWAVGDQRHNF